MEPNYIKPVKTKLPKRIGDPIMPDKTLLVDPLPKVNQPFQNSQGQVVVAPKKKSRIQQFIAGITNNVLKGFFQRIVDIAIGWLLTFAIYAKDGDGNVILDPKTGEPKIKWGSTVIAAILSFVSAATLAKEAFLGLSWGELIELIFKYSPI